MANLINNASKPSILMVEDSHFYQQLIPPILEKIGFSVTLVGNAEQAVELMNEASSCFRLILMDIQLPGMNGLDASAVILKKHTVDIVAFSADKLSNHEEKIKQLGIEYLKKTLSPKVLSENLAPYLKA